jgi:hypothetical protein
LRRLVERARDVDDFHTRAARFLYVAASRQLCVLDEESAAAWDRRQRVARRRDRSDTTCYERAETIDAVLRAARDLWLAGVADFVHAGTHAHDLAAAGIARFPGSRWTMAAPSRLRPRTTAAAIIPMELLTDGSAARRDALRSAGSGFAAVIGYTGARDWLTIGELAAKAGVRVAGPAAGSHAAVIRFPAAPESAPASGTAPGSS